MQRFGEGALTFLLAAAVTWGVTPWVIAGAHRLGALDLPGGRKQHRAPVPRIGGVAVFVGFAVALAFGAAVAGRLYPLPKFDVYWSGFGAAAVGILLLGLVDDVRGISFGWKFAGQIAAAGFIWLCGFRIESILNPVGSGPLHLGWMSLPVTVLWVVGVTNAVNLIDGLDGLASGVALITTVSVAVVGAYRGALGVTVVGVALAGSLVGFLRFNFNPARIFLGDCGSMFLGFVLAVSAVRGSQKGPVVVAIVFPFLVLGLPILDTGFAFLRRLYWVARIGVRSGRPLVYVARNIQRVFLPDRGHIHHRLIGVGLSHRAAVVVLYGVGVVLATAGFAVVILNSVQIGMLMALLLVPLFAGLLYLEARIERGKTVDPAAPARRDFVPHERLAPAEGRADRP